MDLGWVLLIVLNINDLNKNIGGLICTTTNDMEIGEVMDGEGGCQR